MRVVLDSNVIVSGSISAQGAPGQILSAWEEGDFQLIVSPALLAEYRRALGYDRVRARHQKDDEELDEFVARFARFGVLTVPHTSISIITDDPDDNLILECAESGGATHIVSGDPHLLRLESFQGIPILTPRAFIDLLGDG